MGATQEEIVADYMTSYVNYYHLDLVADAAKYEMIVEKNVIEMLKAVVSGPLKGADLAKAAGFFASGLAVAEFINGLTPPV